MDFNGQTFSAADVATEIAGIKDRVLRATVSNGNRFQACLSDNVLAAATNRFRERDSNKEIYHTDCVLSPEQKQELDENYPEFTITAHPTKPKVFHVHVMSRLVSNLNRIVLLRSIKRHGGSLCEFGSNLARSIDEVVAHHCCPILSARDVVRHNNSNRIIQTRFLEGTNEQITNIYNQFHPITGRGVCCKRVEECDVPADVLYGIDTALDINPVTFFIAMIRKKSSHGYLTFPDLSDMLWLDNGVIGILDAKWHCHDDIDPTKGLQLYHSDLTHISSKRPKYVTFFTGSSNGYTHLVSDVLDWLSLPTVFHYGGDLFHTEVRKRPGYLTYEIRRVPYTTAIPLSPRAVIGPLMNEKILIEGEIVTDPVLSTIVRVKMLISQSYVRQVTAWLSSSTKEETGELRMCQFAMYAWSAASRVIVDGQTVQSRELLAPVDSNMVLALLRKAVENTIEAARCTYKLNQVIEKQSLKYSQYGIVRRYLTNTLPFSVFDGERRFRRRLHCKGVYGLLYGRKLKRDMRPTMTSVQELVIFPDNGFEVRLSAFLQGLHKTFMWVITGNPDGVPLIGPFVSSKCNTCSADLKQTVHRPACLLAGKFVCGTCYQYCTCTAPGHMVSYINVIWKQKAAQAQKKRLLSIGANPKNNVATKKKTAAMRKACKKFPPILRDVVSLCPPTDLEMWPDLPPYPGTDPEPLEPTAPPAYESDSESDSDDDEAPLTKRQKIFEYTSDRIHKVIPRLRSGVALLRRKNVCSLACSKLCSIEDLEPQLEVASDEKYSPSQFPGGIERPTTPQVSDPSQIFNLEKLLRPEPEATLQLVSTRAECYTSRAESPNMYRAPIARSEDSLFTLPPYTSGVKTQDNISLAVSRRTLYPALERVDSCAEEMETLAALPVSENFVSPTPSPVILRPPNQVNVEKFRPDDTLAQFAQGLGRNVAVVSDFSGLTEQKTPVVEDSSDSEDELPSAEELSLALTKYLAEEKIDQHVELPGLVQYGAVSDDSGDAELPPPPPEMLAELYNGGNEITSPIPPTTHLEVSETQRTIPPLDLENLGGICSEWFPPPPPSLLPDECAEPVVENLSPTTVVDLDQRFSNVVMPPLPLPAFDSSGYALPTPATLPVRIGRRETDMVSGIKTIIRSDEDNRSLCSVDSEASSVFNIEQLDVTHTAVLTYTGTIVTFIDLDTDLSTHTFFPKQVYETVKRMTPAEKNVIFMMDAPTFNITESANSYEFVFIEKTRCSCHPTCELLNKNCDSISGPRVKLSAAQILKAYTSVVEQAAYDGHDCIQVLISTSTHDRIPIEDAFVARTKLSPSIKKLTFIDTVTTSPYSVLTAPPGKNVPWKKCDFFCEYAIACKSGCTFACAGGAFREVSDSTVDTKFAQEVIPEHRNIFLPGFNVLIPPLLWWSSKTSLPYYDLRALAEWITISRQALVQQMRHFAKITVYRQHGKWKMHSSDSTVSLKNYKLVDGMTLKTNIETGLNNQWFYDVASMRMVAARDVRADTTYILPTDTFNHAIVQMQAILNRAHIRDGFDTSALRGVPGCGKTYTISQLVADKVLPVSITKSSREELIKLLKSHGKGSKVWSVRTLDSHTYQPRLAGSDTVVLDEAFNAHYGQIVFVFANTSVKRVYMLGDDKQIPYINRTSQLTAMYARPPCFVAYQSTVSRRIPRDAAYLISKAYTIPVTTTNPQMRSLFVSHQRSLAIDRACVGDALTLTLHRGELDTVNHRPGVDTTKTRTVHSAQGASVDKVSLVREGKASETQILHKPGRVITPHINVALSRHKEQFVYYTPNENDDISNIVKSVLKVPDETIRAATTPITTDVSPNVVMDTLRDWEYKHMDARLLKFPLVVTLGRDEKENTFTGTAIAAFNKWVKKKIVSDRTLVVVNDRTQKIASTVSTIVSYVDIEFGAAYESDACWYAVFKKFWEHLTSLPQPAAKYIRAALDPYQRPDYQDPAIVLTHLCHNLGIISPKCAFSVVHETCSADVLAYWSYGHYSLKSLAGMYPVSLKLTAFVKPELCMSTIKHARGLAKSRWTEGLQRERDALRGDHGYGRGYSKLAAILNAFPELKTQRTAIDLCCAPGGWTTLLLHSNMLVTSYHFTGEKLKPLLSLSAPLAAAKMITLTDLRDITMPEEDVDVVFCDYGFDDADVSESAGYAANLERIVRFASETRYAVVKVHLDRIDLTHLTTIFAGYRLFGDVPVLRSSSEFWMIKGVPGIDSPLQLARRAALAHTFVHERPGSWLGNYYKVSEALVGEPGQLYPIEKTFDANPYKELTPKRQLFYDTVCEYNRFDDTHEEITAFSFPTTVAQERSICRPPVEDAVMLMQSAYDEALPGISTVPLQYDSAHVAFGGVNLVLNDVSFPTRFGKDSVDNVTAYPQLRTAVSSDMQDSLTDHLMALSKRNCAVLDQSDNSDAVFSVGAALSKFFAYCCHDNVDAMLKDFAEHPCYPSQSALRAYSATLETSKMNNLLTKGVPPTADLPNDQHEQTIKKRMKNSMDYSPLTTLPRCQTVMAQKPEIVAVNTHMWKTLRDRFIALLKPNWMVCIGKHGRNIADYFNQFAAEDDDIEELDIKGFDKSQLHSAMTLTWTVLAMLGMPQEELDRHIRCQVDTTYINYKHKIKGRLFYQNHSGIPGTILQNTILAVIAVVSVMTPAQLECGAAFVGDDQAIINRGPKFTAEQLMKLSTIWNIDAKIITPRHRSPYFCGNFLVYHNSGADAGWHVVADAFKKVERLGRHTMSETDKDELRISLKDQFSSYTSDGLIARAALHHGMRYGDAGWTMMIKSILAIADTPGAFSHLYD